MCRDATTEWAGAAAGAETASLAGAAAANLIDRPTPLAADVLRIATRLNQDMAGALRAAAYRELSPEGLRRRTAEIAETAAASLQKLRE